MSNHRTWNSVVNKIFRTQSYPSLYRPLPVLGCNPGMRPLPPGSSTYNDGLDWEWVWSYIHDYGDTEVNKIELYAAQMNDDETYGQYILVGTHRTHLPNTIPSYINSPWYIRDYPTGSALFYAPKCSNGNSWQYPGEYIFKLEDNRKKVPSVYKYKMIVYRENNIILEQDNIYVKSYGRNPLPSEIVKCSVRSTVDNVFDLTWQYTNPGSNLPIKSWTIGWSYDGPLIGRRRLKNYKWITIPGASRSYQLDLSDNIISEPFSRIDFNIKPWVIGQNVEPIKFVGERDPVPQFLSYSKYMGFNALKQNSNISPTITRPLFDISSFEKLAPVTQAALTNAANTWSTYIRFNPQYWDRIKSVYPDQIFNGIKLKLVTTTEHNGSTFVVQPGNFASMLDPIGSLGMKINTLNFNVHYQPDITEGYTSEEDFYKLTRYFVHQLGHVLGIGVYWQPKYIGESGINSHPRFRPALLGTKFSNAIRAYNKLFGFKNLRKYIPLEYGDSNHFANTRHSKQTNGPFAYHHPPISNDIMTPPIWEQYGTIDISKNITLLSIKALVDLGYEEVNPNSSEGFIKNPLSDPTIQNFNTQSENEPIFEDDLRLTDEDNPKPLIIIRNDADNASVFFDDSQLLDETSNIEILSRSYRFDSISKTWK